VFSWPTPARIASVKLVNHTVTLDYDVPTAGWGASVVPCSTCPLIQEIVYTATEEPGVRDVVVTANGKPTTVKLAPDANPANWQGVTPMMDALSREDVLPYRVGTPMSGSFGGGLDKNVSATSRWSVDDVSPGLARFVVELTGVDAAEPKVDVQASANDEAAQPDLGKQVLRLTVHGISIPEGSTVVDKTPLRSILVSHEPGSATTVHFALGLDDLRPWRVALLANPARIVVDIGGPTANVTPNLALYSLLTQCPAGASPGVAGSGCAHVSGRTFQLQGAARAFEAHVPWRMRNVSGQVVASGSMTASIGTSAYWGLFDTTATAPAGYSGEATLDVFLTSARDGSITEMVSIPIFVP
jgi:hypothetical protein